MMLGLYLGLIAAWLWGCLVFASKPGRTAVFSPVVVPWVIFVLVGLWLFEYLEKWTAAGLADLQRRLNKLGQPAQKGGEA
jgi:hypothetical protein